MCQATKQANIATVLIEDYLDDKQPTLAPIAAKLPRDAYAHFIDSEVLVHFTVAMPLETIAEGGGAAMAEHVTGLFEEGIDLQGLEFRAIGTTPDQFDRTYAGRVHLQCTCQLESR